MFCKIPISILLNIETSIPRYFARRYSVRCWYRVPVYSPTYGYSYESAQRQLANENQHYRFSMIFKNLCILVLLTKVALALEWFMFILNLTTDVTFSVLNDSRAPTLGRIFSGVSPEAGRQSSLRTATS